MNIRQKLFWSFSLLLILCSCSSDESSDIEPNFFNVSAVYVANNHATVYTEPTVKSKPYRNSDGTPVTILSEVAVTEGEVSDKMTPILIDWPPKHNGEIGYVKTSDLDPLTTTDELVFPEDSKLYEVCYAGGSSSGCGGSIIQFYRMPKGHRYVLKWLRVINEEYQPEHCGEFNYLCLGEYIGGAYVFSYEITISSLIYDEDAKDIELIADEKDYSASYRDAIGESDAPVPQIYQLRFGKDVATFDEYTSAMRFDITRLTEGKVMRLFEPYINSGTRSLSIWTNGANMGAYDDETEASGAMDNDSGGGIDWDAPDAPLKQWSVNHPILSLLIGLVIIVLIICLIFFAMGVVMAIVIGIFTFFLPFNNDDWTDIKKSR